MQMRWLMLGCLLLIGASGAQPGEKPEVVYLPMVVVSASVNTQMDARKAPLLIAGALMKDMLATTPRTETVGGEPRANSFPALSLDDGLAATLANGKEKLKGAEAGHTVVFISTPLEDVAKHSWYPTDVAVRGKDVVVTAVRWDIEDATFEVKGRQTFVVSLAALPAGDYTLHVRFVHRVQSAKGDIVYVEKEQAEEAAGRLSVAKAGEGGADAVMVPESELKSVKLPSDQIGIEQYLYPAHWARLGGILKVPMPHLNVGKLNAREAVRQMDAAGNEAAIPTVEQNEKKEYAADDLVAEVVGPQLNSLDWVALDSMNIEKRGEEKVVTITMDYYHDTGARRRNHISTPVVLVPLDKLTKGNYLVSVLWRKFMADRPGELYEEQLMPAGGWRGDLKQAPVQVVVK